MRNGIIFYTTDDLCDIDEDYDFGFTPRLDGTLSVTAFEADGELLEFPAEFRGTPVSRIESYYEGVQWASRVKKIIVHEGIRVVEEQGLSFFYSLQEIELPESLLKLGRYALDGCEALEEIALPDNLQLVDAYAFSNCSSLKRVMLNEGLVGIGDCAFYCCEALEELYIPKSVELIGHNIFTGCSAFLGVRVDEENEHFKSIDGILYSSDGKILYSYPAAREDEVFTVPDGVREIAPRAFAAPQKLRELILPPSVEIITEDAFFSSGTLRRVHLPASVYLERDAFFDCEAVELTYYGS